MHGFDSRLVPFSMGCLPRLPPLGPMCAQPDGGKGRMHVLHSRVIRVVAAPESRPLLRMRTDNELSSV